MNKTTITIILLIIFLLALAGYNIFEKGSEYLQGERQSYYDAGYNNGARYWNDQVINTANSQGKIPFIVNDSVQTISVEQLCGE